MQSYNPSDENAKWALIGGLLVVAGGMLIKWATAGSHTLLPETVELDYCSRCKLYHAMPMCD